jgi:hypothetical protein
VNDFVEECRREWRRLGVPDPVANEMAADLTADLEEAKAEGASPEAVLGRSAFDPRSFARAWATERGVIPPARPNEDRPARRSRLPIAVFALWASTAVAGVVLILGSSTFGQTRVALAASFVPQHLSISIPRSGVVPPRLGVVVPPSIEVPPLPRPGVAQTVGVRSVAWGPVTRVLGFVLLIVGLIGMLLTLSWFGPGRWASRHS